MTKEVVETLTFLPLNDFEQDEKVPKISAFSNAMTLKIVDNTSQTFCQTRPSSFNGREKVVDGSIDKKMRVIE